MLSFLITLGQFVRAIWNGVRDPEFRALFILVIVLLLTGMLFYARVEGWSLLDSLYFSVTTLTTVGYGDLSPSTPASKIFTMVYVLLGIGILVGFLERVARSALKGGDAKTGDTRADPNRRA